MTRVKEIKEERKAQIQKFVRQNETVNKWLEYHKGKNNVDTKLRQGLQDIRQSALKLQTDLAIMCNSIYEKLESMAGNAKQKLREATSIQEKYDQKVQTLQGIIQQQNNTKLLLDEQVPALLSDA